MKTPTKEQIEHIRKYISFLLGKEVSHQMAYNILEQYEKIRS